MSKTRSVNVTKEVVIALKREGKFDEVRKKAMQLPGMEKILEELQEELKIFVDKIIEEAPPGASKDDIRNEIKKQKVARFEPIIEQKLKNLITTKWLMDVCMDDVEKKTAAAMNVDLNVIKPKRLTSTASCTSEDDDIVPLLTKAEIPSRLLDERNSPTDHKKYSKMEDEQMSPISVGSPPGIAANARSDETDDSISSGSSLSSESEISEGEE